MDQAQWWIGAMVLTCVIALRGPGASGQATAPVAVPAFEAQVVTPLRDAGAVVKRDVSLPGRPVVGLDLFSKGPKLQGKDQSIALKGICQLGTVRVLRLGQGVTDADLAMVSQMQSLEELQVSGSSLGDAGIAELTKLKKLRKLRITGEKITVQGFARIAEMRSLRMLGLGMFRASGAQLEELVRMPELCELELFETGTPDDAMRVLKRLPHLRRLTLIQGTDDSILEYLAGMEHLEELELGGCGFSMSDAGLKRIAGFKNLQRLSIIPVGKVTAAGIRELRALSNLKSLSLHQLSPAAIEDVARLEHLEDLSIGGKIKGEHIRQILALQGLRKLSLSFGEIGADDIERLKQLPALEGLELERMNLDDQAAQRLKGFRGMKSLHLDGNAITDAGLSGLAELTKLESLSLNQTRLTDAAIPELVKLRSLRRLEIGGTNISEEGTKRLEKALPDTIVIRWW